MWTFRSFAHTVFTVALFSDPNHFRYIPTNVLRGGRTRTICPVVYILKLVRRHQRKIYVNNLRLTNCVHKQ